MGITFEHLANDFADRFRRQPTFKVSVPGRVNLIGEHTDYNEGLVLPMAIDRRVEICCAPRPDAVVNLYSCNYDQEFQFSLEQPFQKSSDRPWANYVLGVADILSRLGHPTSGFDGSIVGDIPIASGLSSSAAIEVATVLVFAELSGQLPHAPLAVAKLAQRAENDFVGVNCGLMDQFICAAGIEGHALKIACDTMNFDAIQIPDSVAVIVADTKINRTLAGSAYNRRRSECDQAFDMIRSRLSLNFEINSMKDIGLDVVQASEPFLPETLLKRVRHVASENERVNLVSKALTDGDLPLVGELLNESHYSLRDDYEVSSTGLDRVTSLMRDTEGCFGARLTGAGFGGCGIALVDSTDVERIMADMIGSSSQLQPTPEFFRVMPAAGTRVIQF